MAPAACEASTMKIDVNRIPEEGLQEHATYDPSEMDMERFDIRLDAPFEVDAMIMKADRELVVTAQIHCPVRFTCARCLEEFASKVETNSIFSYKIGPADVVDITDDVRQEIILAYPMIPLCRTDCKGLCGACGQDLNRASCSHQAPPGSAAS